MATSSEILRREWEAENGSFVVQLRSQAHWDRAAFSRLINAMLNYAADHRRGKQIERWGAFLFYYLPTYVRTWTEHDREGRSPDTDYFEAALVRLDDLAYYLFTGESPYQGDTGFEPL